MDKATLKIRARFYKKGLATEEQLMSAVEQYTTAIIAQSKCSTPLDVLEQMLIEKQKHQTERSGSEVEIKKYQNGGKYVRDGKGQIPYGRIPKLTDEDIRRFAEVFC